MKGNKAHSTPEDPAAPTPGKSRKSSFRPLRILLCGILMLVCLVLVALQIILNSNFLRQTITRLAADYVEGNATIGNVEISVFSTFPFLNLELEDVLVTYPHERFSQFDTLFFPSPIRSEGMGENGVDTLARIGRAKVRLNYMAALRGDISVQRAQLSGVRAFAHHYTPDRFNWEILPLGSSSEEDTTAKALPGIVLRDIRIDGNPHIVYTSPGDTLFACVDALGITYDGKLDISDLSSFRGTFRIDSLRARGRLPAAEGEVKLDELSISEKKKQYDVLLKADADIGIARIGALEIPLSLRSKVSFPTKGSFTDISLRDISLKAAMLDIEGEADLGLGRDSSYIRAEISMEKCPVSEVIKQYVRTFAPAVGKVRTNAMIDLLVMCDGYLIPSRDALPELIGQLRIPRSNLSFDDIAYTGVIAADIDAMTDSYGKLSLTADGLDINVAGAHLRGSASAEDALGTDPLIEADLRADLDLDRISALLPEGMSASGRASAQVEGMLLKSDLSISNFALADIEGRIESEGFSLRDERDSLDAVLSGVGIELRHYEEGDSRSRALGIFGTVDTLRTSLGKNLSVNGNTLSLALQNGHELVQDRWDKEVHPLTGTLRAGFLDIRSGKKNTFTLANSFNRFSYSARESAPLLHLDDRSSVITYGSSPNGAVLRDAHLEVSAVMNGVIRQRRRDHVLDSLQKVYPSTPRDSLMRTYSRDRGMRVGGGPLSDDFSATARDIEINLKESLLKLYREWDLNLHATSAGGTLSLPGVIDGDASYERLGCKVSTNAVQIDSLTLRSGNSDFSLSGKIDKLRRTLLRKEPLELDLDIKSTRIDVNELMASLTKKDGEKIASTGTDSLAAAPADSVQQRKSPLFVLPRNINAKVRIEGNEIDYNTLVIDWFSTELRLQDRCLQATNTVATSNVGDIYFEGYYATRSKKDISGTFDLNLVDISAEEVIDLIPSVDSIVPMLKSFKGKLDCEMAASTQLDTNMSIVPSTLKGLVSIKGSNLSLDFPPQIQKITKLLLFKDKTTAHVERMDIQGLISDNSLEIFPFILDLDRYELALSGTQNFDQSFSYHASLLESILNFPVGVDLSGTFDNWKYSLVKPRYKKGSLPDYSTKLTQMQYGILDIIHNVFDDDATAALRRSGQQQDALRETFVREDGEKGGELSREERGRLDSLSTEPVIRQPASGEVAGTVPTTTTVTLYKAKSPCRERWEKFTEAVRSGSPARRLRQMKERCRQRRDAKKRLREEAAPSPTDSSTTIDTP